AGAAGAGGVLWQFGFHAWQYRESRRVVHRLAPDASPTEQAYTLRRHHLNGARILPDERRFALELPMGHVDERGRRQPLVLRGGEASAVLSRAMLSVNESGARRGELEAAVTLLSDSGGAERFLRAQAEEERALGMPRVLDYGRVSVANPLRAASRAWRAVGDSFRGVPVAYEPIPAVRLETWGGRPADRLPRARALALEMALHEETERRALEGELAELEAAWREAEEIASIADGLLEVPGLAALRERGDEEG
ncbi:MAG TPA: hypothetical protein VMK65_04405, partial [Longimicrobiales bacterium]|nr:hypothetical protein [Longimicrobiales bacterium]